MKCFHLFSLLSLTLDIPLPTLFSPAGFSHLATTPLPPTNKNWKKKPCKSWKSSHPPVIKYCGKDCNRTKHFDTLDVKTLRAIWFNKWRVASHAIFFFDICDESNSCFQWLYFYTVLFKSSWDSANNKVLIKLECFNPNVRVISD